MKFLFFGLIILVILKLFLFDKSDKKQQVKVDKVKETLTEDIESINSKERVQPDRKRVRSQSAPVEVDTKANIKNINKDKVSIKKRKKVENQLMKEAFSSPNKPKKFPDKFEKGEAEINPYESYIPTN